MQTNRIKNIRINKRVYSYLAVTSTPFFTTVFIVLLSIIKMPHRIDQIHPIIITDKRSCRTPKR